MRRSYSVSSKETAAGEKFPRYSVVEVGGRKAPFLYLVCTKSKNKAPQCKTVGLFGFKDGRFVDVVSLFPLAYSKLKYVLKRPKERIGDQFQIGVKTERRDRAKNAAGQHIDFRRAGKGSA